MCKSKTHKINLLFNLHLKRRIRPRVSRFCVCLQSENNTNKQKHDLFALTRKEVSACMNYRTIKIKFEYKRRGLKNM